MTYIIIHNVEMKDYRRFPEGFDTPDGWIVLGELDRVKPPHTRNPNGIPAYINGEINPRLTAIPRYRW